MSFEITFNDVMTIIGLVCSFAGIIVGCVAQYKTKKLEAQFLQMNEITKRKLDVYSDFSATLHNLPKNILVPVEDLKRLCFIENKIMLLIKNEYKKKFLDFLNLTAEYFSLMLFYPKNTDKCCEVSNSFFERYPAIVDLLSADLKSFITQKEKPLKRICQWLHKKLRNKHTEQIPIFHLLCLSKKRVLLCQQVAKLNK